MTSQVAIFNPLGAAVASDTVATIINDRGIKTLNNAEKMWQLTNEHKVVIALSGSFFINDVPASLLIKAWNESLTEPLSKLTDYVASFKSWLEREETLLTQDSEVSIVKYVLQDHFIDIRDEVMNAARRESLDENEIKNRFSSYAAGSMEYLQSLDLFVNSTDEGDDNLLKSLDIKTDEIVKELLGHLPGFDELAEQLHSQAPLVLSREQYMGSNTHLTFIGFGASEYFATSVEFHIRGRYGKTVRGTVVDQYPSESQYSGGYISAFAQKEAIAGFSFGIEPMVANQIGKIVRQLTKDLVIQDSQDITDADELVAKLNKELERFTAETYLLPLRRTVGDLNLLDAAEFAESLVGIQTMRAKTSPRPAGVGGFIESLVIDKFNGVRWIKRLPQ